MKNSVETIELFNGLSIRIGARTLVDRQSLGVERGKITVLTGASGVGKSILADVVFAVPTAPGLIVEGTVGEARRRGALVFQAGGGLAHLDVRENLLLVRADRARAEELIERFALPATQRPDELWGDNTDASPSPVPCSPDASCCGSTSPRQGSMWHAPQTSPRSSRIRPPAAEALSWWRRTISTSPPPSPIASSTSDPTVASKNSRAAPRRNSARNSCAA